MDTRKIRELADTTSLSKFNKKINSKRNTTVYDYDRNEKDRKKISSLILNSRLIEALIGKNNDVKLSKVLVDAKAMCDEYTIDVRNCGITSIDGYGSKATNVRTLDVSFNRLSDLDKLEGLKQLREIRAHNNVLGPELMDSYVFDGTPNLEVVYLNGNNLVRFPACLRVLRKLRELRLNTNIMEKLTPGILKLSSCRNLEFIDLGGNQLNTLAGLEALGGSVKTLILRNNNLKELHKSIGQLPLLEELDLGANRLTSLRELSKLCNKMNISVLRVDRNRIGDWKSVARLDSLSEFHASNNRFTTIEPIMNKFKNIDVIDLGDNRISEEADVFTLQRLDRLVSLTLSGNPISHVEKISERLCKSLNNLAIYDGYSVSRFGGDDTFEPPGLPLALVDPANENKENSKGARRRKKGKQSEVNIVTGKIKRSNSSASRRKAKEGNYKSNSNDGIPISKKSKDRKTAGGNYDHNGDKGINSHDEDVVESLFSDRSRFAPSRSKKTFMTSSSSSSSFTRSLVEKIFEGDGDNDGKTPRPTPRMMSSRRSRSVLGAGYSNNGVKPLEDVDALAEKYRKKIQSVQKKQAANLDNATTATSSRPSSASSTNSSINFLSSKSITDDIHSSRSSIVLQNSSIDDSDTNSNNTPRDEYSGGGNDYGSKVQAEKVLPKSTLAEALKYARSTNNDKEEETGNSKRSDQVDEGKRKEISNGDYNFDSLKLDLTKAVVDEGKRGEVSNSEAGENDEAPIIVVENTILDQIRSDKSKAWRPPSARQKRGFRGFKIPKKAKEYVHTHLEKK